MGSQVGVPLPGSVWSDYRDSTSLGADLFRLIGGGLTDLGKSKRKEDEANKDRALRQTESQRQASQFAATLAQRQAEHQDSVARWDADRAAKAKDASALYDVDPETGEIIPTGEYGGGAAGPTAFGKAPAAGYQQTYGAAPDDLESDPTPAEKAALKGGGFFQGNGVQAPIEAKGSPAPEAPRGTAFRGRPLKDAQALANNTLARQRVAAAATAFGQKQRQEEESQLAAAAAIKHARGEDLNDAEIAVVAKDPRYAAVLAGQIERRDARVKKEQADTEERNALVTLLDERGKAFPKDSPYARFFITKGPDGKPLPASVLRAQVREMEGNTDSMTRAARQDERWKAIDARRAHTEDVAKRAAERKATIDELKAELAFVEDSKKDIEKYVPIYDWPTLEKDPRWVDLNVKREEFQKAILGAIKPTDGATAPTATAPAAPNPRHDAYAKTLTDPALQAKWSALTPQQKDAVLQRLGK